MTARRQRPLIIRDVAATDDALSEALVHLCEQKRIWHIFQGCIARFMHEYGCMPVRLRTCIVSLTLLRRDICTVAISCMQSCACRCPLYCCFTADPVAPDKLRSLLQAPTALARHLINVALT